MISGLRELNALEETLLRNIHKLPRLRRNLADSPGSCSVRMVSLVDESCVKADDIALLEDLFSAGNSVHHTVVDRDADGRGIALVVEERRNTAEAANHLLTDLVDLHGGDSGSNVLCHLVVNEGQKPPGLTHFLNFAF